MKIRELELDIDIYEELQEFDWVSDVIKGSKFIACSPFRSERHPSFAVNLETGTFIDSGNDDEYHHKGSFVKLLALLRNEDYESVEDYLIDKYSTILADTEALQLHINLNVEADKKYFFKKENIQQLYISKTDYLIKRGISTEVQELFGIGYNPKNNTVAMPWTDSKGQIINIKYRRIDTKAFFYEKEGQPVKHFVYGIYQCKLRKAKRVFLCESEIDALTLWTHGYYAIAVGGSSLSESQKQIILSSGIEELILATDNDKVGIRFRDFLQEELSGHLRLLMYMFPVERKDVNSMTAEEVREAAENPQLFTNILFNLS